MQLVAVSLLLVGASALQFRIMDSGPQGVMDLAKTGNWKCPQHFNAPKGTECPWPVWVDAMVEADPNPDKVIMVVGCNKGDDAIKWMERFDLHNFYSAEKWIKTMDKQTPNLQKVCGSSAEWAKPFQHGFNYKTAVQVNAQQKTTAKPVSVCVEAAKANIDQLHETSAAMGYGSTEFGSFHIIESAVVDKAAPGQTMEFPHGSKGQENLGVSLVQRDEVPVKTVDGIAKDLSLPKVDVLLIDTEGADPLVLKGAASTLASVRYLEFEVHRDLKNTAWSKTSLRSVVTELDSQGFDCYWAGNEGKLMMINRCFQEHFENGEWANAACVKRSDPWAEALQKAAA